MTPAITKEEVKMLEEIRNKWVYYDEKGRHLKPDTPRKLRELDKRIMELYSMFD